ncbi:hypothetical protein [Mycobacterium neglectum]|uniref:hypothetical protein n=1 Tax=Mycobacterium neglectum TaxID=242737 RepID=UPI000BFF17AE|nr:hypothetical protein [Mycobacterium neglectum]
MARFAPRLTAGVGVLVAFLLLARPATVSVADPGRSPSDRGSSSDRGNGNGNRSDRGNGRGGSDRGDDHRRRNDNSRKHGEDDRRGSAERGSVESPEAGTGSGPIDRAGIAPLAPSLAAGKGGDGDGSAERRTADVADAAELSPSIAAESGEPGASVVGGVDAADSPDRSGSYRADVPKARFSPPRLTLGNGHTPGIRRGEFELRRQAPSLPPAPVASPPAPLPALEFRAPAPPPSFVTPLPSAPVLTQQLGVSQEADWSDPLWGLTGLLLIPAAGAILGYRQARAAHAADRLRRS